MKIRLIASLTCCCTFLLALFGTFMLMRVKSPGSVASAVEFPAAQAVNVSANEGSEQSGDLAYYILKEYQGSVCVFNGGYREIPAIVTSIKLDSLTTQDQELLFQGIVVHSREELLQLLEDFGS